MSPMAPLANGSVTHLVLSSQDAARWTWTSRYAFDAPRWCALEHGASYITEAEAMLREEEKAFRDASQKLGAVEAESSDEGARAALAVGVSF